MVLLDLTKDLPNNATQADAVKALKTKFPAFSDMSDTDFAAAMADSDASTAFLKAYDPAKALKGTPEPVKVAVAQPSIHPAVASFQKSTNLPSDAYPPDVVEKVLRDESPDLFKSDTPGTSTAAPTMNDALKVAVGYALPKLPDSLARLLQANASGTLNSLAGVTDLTKFNPGLPVSNLAEPLQRAAATIMPPGNLSKGERFLSGDKTAAADAIAPTESEIEKKAGSGTIPYFDIARKAVADTLAPLIPNPLNAVEDAMWMAIPAAQKAAIGVIADGIGVGKVHPILRGYVQTGILGAAFGATTMPNDNQASTYLKNVGEGLAAGILLHGMGSAVDGAAQELGLGKLNAYRNLRQTVIDQFVEKGVYPKEAAAMADFGIDQAIKTGGSWTDVKASDLRAAKAAILRGEKLILGNAEEEPAEPAALKGPTFGGNPTEPLPNEPPAGNAPAHPAAPSIEPTTSVDGQLLGGPEGVQRLQGTLPILANEILGKKLPFEPDVLHEALNQAFAVHDSSLKTGTDPNDAQIASAKAFTDYLSLIKKPVAVPPNVPQGTSEQPTPPESAGRAIPAPHDAAKMGLPAALDLDPHELTYDQFKAVYGHEVPEDVLQEDYRGLIQRAIRSNKSVSNEVIASIPTDNKYKAITSIPDALKESPATSYDDSEKRAVDFFGLTDNIDHAGYVLSNGSLLDITGEKRGKPTDHREIATSFLGLSPKSLDTDVSGWLYKQAFMKNARALRVVSNGDLLAIQSVNAPSLDQLRTIVDSIIEKKPKRLSMEIIGRGGDSQRFKEIDEPTPEDISRFYYGTSQAAEARAVYAKREPSAASVLKQPAYHGSPHKFDKFSLQKIGSGEGNQTFGWGLYFSGKKDVAEFYRNSLTPPQEIPANVRLAMQKVDNLGFDRMAEALNSIREEMRAGRNWQETWPGPYDTPELKDAVAAIDEYAKKPVYRGSVYQVEIPEDSDYLDFDKLLTKQSDSVKDKLKASGIDPAGLILDKGSDLYRGLYTGRFPDVLKKAGLSGNPEGASKFLNSIGIPGLRYLDQASRISGEGTYNYVLFDDNRINITKVHETEQAFNLRQSFGTVEPGVKQLSLQLEYKPTQPERALAPAAGAQPEPTGEVYIAGEKIGQLVKDSPFAVQYKKDGFLVIPNKKISGPSDIAFAFQFLKHQLVENFFVGAVKNGRIVSVEHASVGTFDQVAVYPFEAITLLDHTAADSFFIVHNHPSGKTVPSTQDIQLTKKFREIFEKNGLHFLGHVIINDTHFGFIDKNLAVAQYEHQEYEKIKKIPVLKKYAEWTMSKSAYSNEPSITNPKDVFELTKGIRLGKNEAMVFFLNFQHTVNASLVMPHAQLNAGNLQYLAGRYRGAAIAIANANLSGRDLKTLSVDLNGADIRLLDSVDQTADGNFQSSMERGLFEPKGEYILRDPGLEDEYAKARKNPGIQPKETTREFLQQRKNVITDFFKYIGQVSSKSLYKIGPQLMYASRRFESDYRQQTRKDLIRAQGLLHALGELKKESPADDLVMDIAMKNGDMGMQTIIAQQYGFFPELEKTRLLLEEMRHRIQSVGYQVGYRTGYFPRVIRDKKGLLKFIAKQDDVGGEIDHAIRDKEFELGRQLNDDEKANLINSFIRGFVRSKIALAKTGNMKRREIERVTVDMAKFYYGGREGLVRYIEQVNEAVEARKFFGRVEVKPELDGTAKAALAEMSENEQKQSALSWNNIQDSIGAYVNRLLDQRKITPSQQLELKNIFLSRFGYIGTTGIFGLYKNLEYMSTIANPIAGLSQLDDLAAALYMAPWHTPGSFFRALASKSKISLKDLGLESIAEEIREASKTSAGLREMLRRTGFTYFDRVMKETHTNALIDSYRAKARAGDAALDSKLFQIFGSEADAVLDDLKADRTTDNVLFLAFNELSDYQPITLLEVPRAYQDSPGGRVFYMLKTFFLKRLDFLMSSYQKEPNKLFALRALLYLYGLYVIFGAGVDVMKDLVLGRKINPSDLLIDNLLKPFGISKYLLYKVREEGPGEVLSFFLTPSHKLLDSIFKDVFMAGKPVKVGNHHEPRGFEIPGSIPIGGKLWYWWFGRGAQKTRQQQFKAQQPHSAHGKKAGAGMYNF